MSKELAKTYDPAGIEDRLYKNGRITGIFTRKWTAVKALYHCDAAPNITGQLPLRDTRWTTPCRIF